MKIQAFYTADMMSLISLAIMSAARGRFAHTGLLFTATQDEWEELCKEHSMLKSSAVRSGSDGHFRFYFESVSKRDKITGKTGARGPYPFSKLADWKGASSHRRLDIQDIPLCDKGAQRAVKRAIWAVPRIKYAYKQIWRNWLELRWGEGTPLRKRAEDRWTCVEFNVECIASASARYAIKQLRLGRLLFVEYAPSSSRGPGLHELVANKEPKQGDE